MLKPLSFALLLSALPAAALADDIKSALDAALAAHEKGDLSATAAQITNATRAVHAQQQARLTAKFPEAPAGWTRTIQEPGDAGMMMAMAGVTTEARYEKDDGSGFSLTLAADSPVATSMMGMFASPQMLAMMGKTISVGGQDMLVQDNSLTAMAGGRVLVQAQGMDPDAMVEVLSLIDYASLPQYDR
ncbi:hypothetical protein Q9295_02980 [Xinfangfangia sp. CPCC 101601]|uniref:Uncharacterized protein n=1 Tax=Pseudogemmobacter lacusdianii TaxID=3069608 RepID=A0ABU0VUC4_9RHOB|nr:hypothetical protein [Xinfangfangia sp. CPCC 101601]MDQ2065327.1 hypothetical protein [Xinfangfangia sp. CPCC 101601]